MSQDYETRDGIILRGVPDGTPEAEIKARIAKIRAERPAPESPTSFRNLTGAALEPNASLLSGAVATPLAGLAGIAGSVLPGPEGQGADWTQKVQENLTYAPRTAGGRTATEAIGYPFRKLGEGADYAGEKTAELTGSPAVGAGVNAGIQVGLPAGLAALLRMAPAKNTAQGQLAHRLMQSAVKPTADDLMTGKAPRAINTMLEEGINPTSGGMDKLQGTVRGLDAQVKDAIANSTATVNVPRVGSRLQEPYSQFRNQVNPRSDLAALDNVWNEFRKHPDIAGKTEIPVQLAQKLKSGTYRSLGEKAYGEIGTSSMEGQKALARGMREEIAAKVPEVVAPLRRESDLMNVLSVAERRALIEANKNPMGLSLLAQNPYAWAGFMADKSALFKSLAARLLHSSGDPNLARAGMTGAMVNQEQP